MHGNDSATEGTALNLDTMMERVARQVPQREPRTTVTVEFQGLETEVDNVLAPLQLALRELHIQATVEGGYEPNRRFILTFATAEDAQEFLNLVAVYPRPDELRLVDGFYYVGDTMVEDTLFGHAVQICDRDSNWKYVCEPFNRTLVTEVVNGQRLTTQVGPPDFRLPVVIYIPMSDLPGILDRLTSASTS